jgi:hypothetical protein
MSPTRPFVFEMVFEDGPELAVEPAGSATGRRSVIVEVELAGTAPVLGGRIDEAATREFADALASEAALQAIAKDLPHGVAPDGLVTPPGELPPALRRRSPTLQGDPFRAWLL